MIGLLNCSCAIGQNVHFELKLTFLTSESFLLKSKTTFKFCFNIICTELLYSNNTKQIGSYKIIDNIKKLTWMFLLYSAITLHVMHALQKSSYQKIKSFSFHGYTRFKIQVLANSWSHTSRNFGMFCLVKSWTLI